MDRIVFKDMSEVQSLLAWRDMNKDLVRNAPPTMNEGIIIYRDENTYKQVFSRQGNEVHHSVCIGNKQHLNFMYNIASRRVHEVNVSVDFALSDYPKDEAIQDALTVHASIMAFMAYYREDPSLVRRERRVSGSGRHRKKKTSHIVYLSAAAFVSNHSVPDARGSSKMYTVESWNVRGHFRFNPRTGQKDIWVNPYQKGKGHKAEKQYRVSQ